MQWVDGDGLIQEVLLLQLSGTYENVLLEYLNQKNSMWGNLTLTAPGSEENISTESSLECLRKVVNYITK